MSTHNKSSRSPRPSGTREHSPTKDITDEIEDLIETIDPSLASTATRTRRVNSAAKSPQSGYQANLLSSRGTRPILSEPYPTEELEELIEQASPRSKTLPSSAKRSAPLQSPPTSKKSTTVTLGTSSKTPRTAYDKFPSVTTQTNTLSETESVKAANSSPPKELGPDNTNDRATVSATSVVKLQDQEEPVSGLKNQTETATRAKPKASPVLFSIIVLSVVDNTLDVHRPVLPAQNNYTLPGQVEVVYDAPPVRVVDLIEERRQSDSSTPISTPDDNIITLESTEVKRKRKGCIFKLCTCLPGVSGDLGEEDEEYVRSGNAVKMDFIEEIRIEVDDDEKSDKDKQKKGLWRRVMQRVRNLFVRNENK